MGSVMYQKFEHLNKVLLEHLSFFDPEPVKPIVFSNNAAFLQRLTDQIIEGGKSLSSEYHAGYIEPLVNNLSKIVYQLTPIDEEHPTDEDKQAYAYLTLLANAAVQPAQPAVKRFLKPVQRVVNDIYASFLKSRAKLGIDPPDQKIKPLAGFVGPLGKISEQAPVPSTFEVEQMQSIDWLGELARDFTVGAVLLPAGYKDAPLLWSSLGHEIGGHYVLAADRGDKLFHELGEKIYDMVIKEYSREIAALWLHWTEEATSDVCGVLNFGPSFGIGAISFYTAQLYLGKWSSQTNELETTFYTEYRHPTQILVPHVIRGAIEGLRNLGLSRKDRYIAQAEEIAQPYAKGRKTIKFPRNPTLEDIQGKTVQLSDTQSLEVMQKSARRVGQFIATVPLTQLKGGTLQDLATWNDSNEEAAISVADQLVGPKSGPMSVTTSNAVMPRSLELLSGGILAVIRKPDEYKRVNDILLSQFAANRYAE